MSTLKLKQVLGNICLPLITFLSCMASLITLGVSGKLLNIIKSLYQNLKSRVNSEDNISEKFTCNVGVRQRESLSPFLFAVYINDIEETFYTKRF